MGKENLGSIIKLLYPEAVANKTVVIKQDNEEEGPYIAVWDDSLGAKPKEEELIIQHEAAAIAAYEQKEIAKEEEKKIEKEIFKDDIIGTLKAMVADLTTRVEKLEGKK
jgi:hypothetical protein